MLNSFTVHTGMEGPAHDPWSCADYTFTNIHGQEATLHQGLTDYIEWDNGNKFTEVDSYGEMTPFNIFAGFVGVEPKVLKRLLRKVDEQDAVAREFDALMWNV